MDCGIEFDMGTAGSGNGGAIVADAAVAVAREVGRRPDCLLTEGWQQPGRKLHRCNGH
jgi:hypothetical protein